MGGKPPFSFAFSLYHFKALKCRHLVKKLTKKILKKNILSIFPIDKSKKVWYNKYRKGKGDDLMERKITSKAEFLEAIKREKQRRKKVAEAQEKKLAKIEIEKKKKMTFIERGF